MISMDEEMARLMRRMTYESRPMAKTEREAKADANRFLRDPHTPSCFGWLTTPDFHPTESDLAAVLRPTLGDRE